MNSDNNKKRCFQCNTENPIEANFCRHCGAILNDTEEANTVYSDTIVKERDSLRLKVKTLQQELLACQQVKTTNRLSHRKTNNKKIHIVYVLLIFVFIVLGGLLGAFLYSVNTYNYYSDYRNLSDFTEEYSKYKPFDVIAVDIRNKGQEYGDDIYSKNTTYINPRIRIAGFKNGTYKFQVKFYNRYGDLSQGQESPTNYSYEDECYINSNEIKYYELNGWGSKEHGNWQSGEYRIEIWYNNKKIAQKQFKIYSNSNSNDDFFDCDTTVAE